MADFNISGRMKIKTLKDDFKAEFGGTLRVYDGRSHADDSATVGSVAKKTVSRGSEVSANGNLLVKTFEERMKETYGIRVEVATADDSKLADDGCRLGSIS
jgi:hypothetical protein